MSHFQIVEFVAGVAMDTAHGAFEAAAIRLRSEDRASEHLCLYRGVYPNASCLLRLNSACMTSELFGCRRCDCEWQLRETLCMFREETSCAVVYTPTDEGRGHGIIAKLRSFVESDGSAASGLRNRYQQKPDARDFGAQAHVAHWLGIRRARLLTDNPCKVKALETEGVEVVSRVSLRSPDPRFAELYRYRDELLSEFERRVAGTGR